MTDGEKEKNKEERGKLDSYAESIGIGIRIFREINEQVEAFVKNGNSFVECAECGCLRREKTGD